jgi:hypothetical protein
MNRQNKYNKKSTVQICLRLNKKTDADIIEYIELLKKNNISVNGTIRMLFRFMLKEIAESRESLSANPEIGRLIEECKEIVKKYGGKNNGGNK